MNQEFVGREEKEQQGEGSAEPRLHTGLSCCSQTRGAPAPQKYLQYEPFWRWDFLWWVTTLQDGTQATEGNILHLEEEEIRDTIQTTLRWR